MNLALIIMLMTLAAPPEPRVIGTFSYRQPLTNCWLEQSTDLVHWTTTDRYQVETNADGTIGWALMDKKAPAAFFRVGGEAL